MRQQFTGNSLLNTMTPSDIRLTFRRILFLLIMLTGIFARIWQFGTMPGDINQDEAFAGYEAYSLLHYGMDSAGYCFPIYLTTWGSGMNALNTYLMIPFMALFGCRVWVIRLPQVIIAILTLPTVYLIAKRLTNDTTALFTLFLLAIAPWHIGLSRWGLESNLAPGFLIFGLYFFLRGMDNSKFFILSFLMYGLSLYCYAAIWPVVPLILLLQLSAGILTGKIRPDRWLLLSGILLGLMALPLLLFLLINMGYLEEIRLSFFSIPRLVYMRSGEVSLKNLPQKAADLWQIVTGQDDGLATNGTSEYGIYYMDTFFFFWVGLFYCIKSAINKFKKRQPVSEFFLLVQLAAGIILGLLIYSNINRINILFIPMIMTAAIGISRLFSTIKVKYMILPVLFYLIMFIGFEHYYFTDYRQLTDYYFCRGLNEAVTEADSYKGPVYFSRGLTQARILFFTRLPVQEYIDTVEYYNYPSPYLDAKSFGRYSFDFDSGMPDINATYCLNQYTDLTAFKALGFTLHTYGNYTVAHHPDNLYDSP